MSRAGRSVRATTSIKTCPRSGSIGRGECYHAHLVVTPGCTPSRTGEALPLLEKTPEHRKDESGLRRDDERVYSDRSLRPQLLQSLREAGVQGAEGTGGKKRDDVPVHREAVPAGDPDAAGSGGDCVCADAPDPRR